MLVQGDVTTSPALLGRMKKTRQGYVGSRVCICVLLLLLLLSRFSRVRLCATHRQQPTSLPHP